MIARVLSACVPTPSTFKGTLLLLLLLLLLPWPATGGVAQNLCWGMLCTPG